MMTSPLATASQLRDMAGLQREAATTEWESIVADWLANAAAEIERLHEAAKGQLVIVNQAKQALEDADRLRALNAHMLEALRANLTFAEEVAKAADIDLEETAVKAQAMPEGREVASRTWSQVLQQGHAAIAKAEGR